MIGTSPSPRLLLSVLLLLSIGAVFPSKARSQDADTSFDEFFGIEKKEKATFGGFFHSRLNVDPVFDNSREDIVELRNGVFLRGDFEPLPRLRFGLSARFYHQTATTEGGDFDYIYSPELFEAYASLTWEKLDLKLGKQVARWGRADVSPTDNLNPADLRDFLFTEPEFEKIPILMAKATYYTRGISLEGAYIPFYEPMRLAPLGNDWFVVTPRIFHRYYQENPDYDPDEVDDTRLRVENTEFPEPSLENGELGFRVARSGTGFDFGFDYLFTWEDFYLPVFNPDFIQYVRENMADCRQNSTRACADAEEILFDLAPQELVAYAPLYYLATDRTNIFGADFATAVGGLGLQAEAAFFWKASLLREDFSIVKKPILAGSLGADYLINGRHYVNLQILETWILGWDKDIYFLKEAFPIFVLLFRTSLGASDQYEPEVRASFNPAYADYLIDVLISYKLDDQMKFSLGATFMGGPEHSFLGLFAENDSIHAGFRYSF